MGAIWSGYGVVDITPPSGEFCSFRLAPNKRSLGVHDNLSVHAFYLTNGEEDLIMITVDTAVLCQPVVDEIKARIASKAGVPTSRILIAATHTHNGAELIGEEPYVDIRVQLGRVS